jgi:formylmethanofuran dehydrogenase subunit B
LFGDEDREIVVVDDRWTDVARKCEAVGVNENETLADDVKQLSSTLRTSVD